MKVLRSLLYSFLLCFSLLTITSITTSCTSSEEGDETVFEGEFDDVGEGSEEELEEEFGDEGGEDDFDDEDEDEEFAEEDDEDFDDEEGDDDEDLEDELADDDDEFDDEFDDGDDDEDLAEEDGEDLLAKELGVDEDEMDAPGDDGEDEVDGLPDDTVGQAQAPQPPAANVISSEGSTIALEEFIPVPGDKLPQDDLGVADPISAIGNEPPPPPVPEPDSISRMKTEPYIESGALINAIYFARPGDNFNKISDKIFQADKASFLAKLNPHLKGKKLDPGDKVYYTSTVRPDDKGEIKTFYADKELPAQTYITKKNDSIRKLGRELLGFEQGWKELWAMNSQITTKEKMPAGLEIKYWTGSEQKQQLADANIPEDPSQATVEEIPGSGDGDLDPPTGNDEEIPPVEDVVAEVQDPNMEDVGDISDPGLEALSAGIDDGFGDEGGGPMEGGDNLGPPSQGPGLLTLGLVAIVAVALVALVAVQIKNRKVVDDGPPPSMEYTQV